jgi:rod shape-determining protein MreC
MALSGRTRSTRGLVILLVTASLVTITIDYKEGRNGPLAKLGDAALSVIAPLQNAVTRVTRPIGSFFSGVAKVPSLQARIQQLESQLREVQARDLSRVSLEQQLSRLQNLLDLKQTLGLDHSTGARVIASGVSNFEWSVDIDKGSRDEIRPGMAVVADGGLVGNVTQVSPFASKVTLILDPGMKVAARLVSSQTTGELVGQGNHDIRMDLVDASTRVDVGEPVETVGFPGGLYPPGIPIGQVSSVGTDRVTNAKLISVRPAVDFSSLDYVLVVQSPESR